MSESADYLPEQADAQHEQTLRTAIAQAIALPSSANLLKLLHDFDEVLPRLPHRVQLQIGGELLAQLIDIHISRVNLFLEEWELRHTPPCLEEPILTFDMLQSVLRQSMTLNLDELLDLTSPLPNGTADDSLVAMIDPQNLLQFLEKIDQEQTQRMPFDIAHDENIAAWTDLIRQWLNQQLQSAVSFRELQRSLQRPPVEIWLALLLGDFVIEHQGEFYQGEIWIKQGTRSSAPAPFR
ncbi:MAG: hypothetical protein NW220_15350 [Leptolyngbyaceae cyanobacterium bins.349]|nr:hypothetical protein [Leptolyngbyaceae cyanobacterium bins.349]